MGAGAGVLVAAGVATVFTAAGFESGFGNPLAFFKTRSPSSFLTLGDTPLEPPGAGTSETRSKEAVDPLRLGVARLGGADFSQKKVNVTCTGWRNIKCMASYTMCKSWSVFYLYIYIYIYILHFTSCTYTDVQQIRQEASSLTDWHLTS